MCFLEMERGANSMNTIRLHSNKTIWLGIAVLILIISTVSYTFSLFADANEQVEQNITNFSRGTYDILIRPEDSRTDLEKELNLIEENYLGIGDGGITIDEWENIKSHPDVEIAAPVASIGLFTAMERTFMKLKDPLEMQYYEVEYSTSDGGVHTYKREKEWIVDFGTSIEEFLHFPSSYDVSSVLFSRDLITFLFPTSYHQVVAVDAEEEGKLTTFDLGPLEEEIFDYNAYRSGKYAIPIMSLGDVTLPVQLVFTMDDLSEPSLDEIDRWRTEFNKHMLYSDHPQPENVVLYEKPEVYRDIVEEYIMDKRKYEEEVYDLVPEEDHSPFLQEILYLDKDNILRFEKGTEEDGGIGLGQAIDPHTHRIGYLLDPVEYTVKDDQTLVVKQIGVDEIYEAPTYRELEEVEYFDDEIDPNPEVLGGLLNEEGYFNFTENGTFSIIENTSDLASSPLGIYGREAPYLADDPSKTLHPSAVPGSFINTPAHGLISIDHAEYIKGDKPIDAIRVKVAGITGYDKKAADLIESMASEFEAQGFTIDIVAGASLQDLTVEVEEIGDVIQSFTTLGAADTVISSWNAMQIGLTILYALVALIFVSFMFFNLLADRKKDEELLARLGWSEAWIRKLRNREWRMLLGAPIVLVSLAFAGFGFWQGEWSPLILSIALSLLLVFLYFFSLSLTNKQKRTFYKQLKSITFQNIRYYRNQLLAASIQLFLTTIITCFLPFFLIEHVQMTKQTRLGAYVHGEIEGIFIVVIVLLYVLSLTTIYQTFRRLWEQRASEIKLFQTIGWDKRFVRSYFLKEIMIWAGGSAILGLLVSMGITLLLLDLTVASVLLQSVGLILIVSVAVILSLYTLRKMNVQGEVTDLH